MNKEYTPNPADTGHIALSPELEALAEDMARNVHEVWAAGRIAEGWRYGPCRDDEKRLTPCLVPYDQLPESEKEYDRATSRETIRYILAAGFKIIK